MEPKPEKSTLDNKEQKFATHELARSENFFNEHPTVEPDRFYRIAGINESGKSKLRVKGRKTAEFAVIISDPDAPGPKTTIPMDFSGMNVQPGDWVKFSVNNSADEWLEKFGPEDTKSKEQKGDKPVEEEDGELVEYLDEEDETEAESKKAAVAVELPKKEVARTPEPNSDTIQRALGDKKFIESFLWLDSKDVDVEKLGGPLALAEKYQAFQDFQFAKEKIVAAYLDMLKEAAGVTASRERVTSDIGDYLKNIAKIFPERIHEFAEVAKKYADKQQEVKEKRERLQTEMQTLLGNKHVTLEEAREKFAEDAKEKGYDVAEERTDWPSEIYDVVMKAKAIDDVLREHILFQELRKKVFEKEIWANDKLADVMGKLTEAYFHEYLEVADPRVARTKRKDLEKLVRAGLISKEGADELSDEIVRRCDAMNEKWFHLTNMKKGEQKSMKKIPKKVRDIAQSTVVQSANSKKNSSPLLRRVLDKVTLLLYRGW